MPVRFLLSAVIALVVASCGEKPAPRSSDTASPGKLIIGMDATYPPFEFTNDKGEISGVSTEIGREIGRALGREVEFRNINFDGLIVALKTGSIGLIISSMTANDERRKSIEFSDPYVKTGLSVLVSKKSPVEKSDDLKAAGRRVVVRLGTTGEMWARKELPQAQIVALDTDAACVLEVVNGTVDAWVYDQISIMNYHDRNRDSTRALLAPLREEVWAIGMRQGEEETKAKINEALARFRAEGGFAKLADNYLAKERDMMKAQGLPFVFELAP
jgi:polar amino acid transport system substrate-binding protein